MFVRDLDPMEMFGVSAPLRAVGWLDGTDYANGEVSAAWFDSLLVLSVCPWEPAAAGGRHLCPYCRFTGGPGTVNRRGTSAQVGASNVWVPDAGRGVVYVAPSLMLHYVDAHGYRPPDVFQAAVTKCPEMRSIAYLRALRAAGLSVVKATNPV